MPLSLSQLQIQFLCLTPFSLSLSRFLYQLRCVWSNISQPICLKASWASRLIGLKAALLLALVANASAQNNTCNACPLSMQGNAPPVRYLQAESGWPSGSYSQHSYARFLPWAAWPVNVNSLWYPWAQQACQLCSRVGLCPRYKSAPLCHLKSNDIFLTYCCLTHMDLRFSQ